MLPKRRNMKASAKELSIAKIIEPVIEDLGFELVQLRLIGSQKLQTLQIMAEDPNTGTLDLNACTAVSRAVSAVLDVEDPIASAYQLEVSSPGIDRPLTREKDFEAHKGHEISVETATPTITGQKKFKGNLVQFDKSHVFLVCDGETVSIPFEDITKAKLVLTDDLLKKGQKK